MAGVCENGFCVTRSWKGILWQQILRMHFVAPDCRNELCGSRV